MAFTQTTLDALKQAYAAGTLRVKHGDKEVTYASMSDLWDAIQRIERSLTPAAQKYSHGVIRFRRQV